jgi:hypothetical protein
MRLYLVTNQRKRDNAPEVSLRGVIFSWQRPDGRT